MIMVAVVLICLIALFATTLTGFAQSQGTTSIRGRVLDNETMEPLMGAAVVSSKYNNIYTTVNAKGEFELKNVPKEKDFEIKITFTDKVHSSVYGDQNLRDIEIIVAEDTTTGDQRP